MRHLLTIFATLALAVSCSSPNAQREPLKVMSFNIRYDNPGDSANAWPNRRDAIVRMIAVERPAVLGIQEGLAHQVAFLDSALTGYSYVGVGRDDGATAGEYAAIFYNDSIFEVEQGENVWLSPTPDTPSMGWDAVCIRQLNCATLRDRSTGERLLCMNTHFDHIGQQARAESARMMLERVAGLEAGVSWVLMGDFNCTTADSSLRLLSQVPGVIEARDYATKNGFMAPSTVDYTYYGFEPGTRRELIDHIYCGDSFKPTEYKIITENYGIPQLSDHLPVEVSLGR